MKKGVFTFLHEHSYNEKGMFLFSYTSITLPFLYHILVVKNVYHGDTLSIIFTKTKATEEF